jgi:cytochrome P450
MTIEEATVDPAAILFSPDAADEPQRAYQELHAKCPVARVDGWDGTHKNVIVTKYEDVLWALKHPEVFSSAPEAVNIGQADKLIPLQIDPPDHASYRRLLDPEFSPRKMALLEPEIREMVNGLIDGFIDQGECNFHEDYATPIPSAIFLALMGLSREDLPKFLRWRDETIRPDVPAGDLEAAQAARERVGHEITAYFDAQIDRVQAEPEETLLGRIVAGQVDGRDLTREELLGTLHLLLLGGLDTVTATLDCAIGRLAKSDDARRWIAADPTCADSVVEELLRTETPVMMVVRVVKQDCEIGGVQVHAGDHASILIGAANADESQFTDAHLANFDRPENRHVAFGAGPHRCLGSHLARLELRIALEEWHRRIPEYRIADGADVHYSPGIRQADTLPLVWST